ncbi:BEL1-like homeodomain protein 7 [Striga hermonthica]|uniref:BEL1-like homeodomain protein 7 n=1 Tax=Striga hermonthica TaxID=68872 RepID=A0A9N7MJI0_STRHE|nr:BEL1-like homeodomain protein 7 [Striga hermonthica]
MSNNPRHNTTSTMVYLRDRLPESQSDEPIFPSNTIMYTNYSSMDFQPSDSSTSQQEILLNFNQWKDNREEILMMQPASQNSSVQGLSLSLSTNVQSVLQMPSIHYNNPDFSSVLGHDGLITSDNGDGYQVKQTRDEDFVLPSSSPNTGIVANEVAPFGRAVPDSKYLRAAQELLDEVVSVKDFRERIAKKENLKDSKENEGDLGSPSGTPKASGNSSSCELSVAEKQELQSKMSKLLAMLDEVDRRYRQYYHQMQIVVSSFDMIAGPGSSKPYTSLALQTISRHFRCLRDAINSQIQAARKSLGEDDASSSGDNKGIGISRLRYVDKQLRQQRALQQLGIMQQHAWRPQRGLPETSVSILRAWLFEHFLHPYPKDSEKLMLARQTGLTRSQVSNWFINARVRLWKPMVEEMYKEETGDADVDSNSSSEKTNTKDNKREDSMGPRPVESNPTNQMTDNTEGPDEMPAFRGDYGSGKTRNGPNVYVSSATGAATYNMSELGRFGGVDPVSLTLGLQQGEGGGGLNSHGFNPLREGVGYNDAAAAAMANEAAAEFDYMDSGNRQHPFMSSLLPSFS